MNGRSGLAQDSNDSGSILIIGEIVGVIIVVLMLVMAERGK